MSTIERHPELICYGHRFMYQYEDITIEQAHQILANPSCIVFDIRDDRSYEQGRLPGAMRFNDQLIRKMRRTEQRNDPVLIYCYHGVSSKDVAQMLCDFGFPKVYSLNGGYTAWEAAQNRPDSTAASSNATNNISLPNEICAWLTKHGFDAANINQPIDHGISALMQACRFGQAAMAKALLLAGADVNLTNNDGNNALWLACFSGDLETINVLLEHGVEIDNRNVTGATALIYASSAGKSAVVQKLLEAGANPHIQTQDDFTALDLAASPQAYRFLRSYSS